MTIARSSKRLATATSAAATNRPGSDEPSRTPRSTPGVTSMPTPSPRSGPMPVTSCHRSLVERGVSRSAMPAVASCTRPPSGNDRQRPLTPSSSPGRSTPSARSSSWLEDAPTRRRVAVAANGPARVEFDGPGDHVDAGRPGGRPGEHVVDPEAQLLVDVAPPELDQVVDQHHRAGAVGAAVARVAGSARPRSRRGRRRRRLPASGATIRMERSMPAIACRSVADDSTTMRRTSRSEKRSTSPSRSVVST